MVETYNPEVEWINLRRIVRRVSRRILPPRSIRRRILPPKRIRRVVRTVVRTTAKEINPITQIRKIGDDLKHRRYMRAVGRAFTLAAPVHGIVMGVGKGLTKAGVLKGRFKFTDRTYDTLGKGAVAGAAIAGAVVAAPAVAPALGSAGSLLLKGGRALISNLPKAADVLQKLRQNHQALQAQNQIQTQRGDVGVTPSPGRDNTMLYLGGAGLAGVILYLAMNKKRRKRK